jgi:hypothetical protein
MQCEAKLRCKGHIELGQTDASSATILVQSEVKNLTHYQNSTITINSIYFFTYHLKQIIKTIIIIFWYFPYFFGQIPNSNISLSLMDYKYLDLLYRYGLFYGLCSEGFFVEDYLITRLGSYLTGDR